MLVLAAIVVLHIINIILLLVATIDNAWWITKTTTTELWGTWELKSSDWHYFSLKGYPEGSPQEEYLQTVQATSVLACIFTILALCVFMAQLFTLPKCQRFTLTGIFQLIGCVCIMIAASVYTAELHASDTSGGYGHCYVLAWISFVVSFILAITYLILKKTGE